MYAKYKSPFGYSSGDNQIDSYGVDHSGFSLRDELEYQTARQAREHVLKQNFARQGKNKDYPQYGAGFWGRPENNYGFGSSDIGQNIAERPFTPFPSALDGKELPASGRAEEQFLNLAKYENWETSNNNHCAKESSLKKFINKFNDLEYMTDIPHTISTGNKFIDKNIAKYGRKIMEKLIKDPRAKMFVKISEKAYPYIENGAANLARAKAAYEEVFNKN